MSFCRNLFGYPLHLPRAGAGGVHLGQGRHKRAVDPPVALDRVVGEETPGPGGGEAGGGGGPE